MKVERAARLLYDASRGQLTATAPELDELSREGLVLTVAAWASRALGELNELATSHGSERDPLDPAWLRQVLTKVEGELRSDLHRMVTSHEALHKQELERASMRRLLGLLEDPSLVEGLRRATAQRATREPLLPGPDRSLLVSLSPVGRRALPAITARLARSGSEPLAAFLKRFLKAEQGMRSLAEGAAYLSQGVGQVAKGKAQVVTGLLKTGLPPERALAAFQRAGTVVGALQAPKEAAHLAVSCVRGAGQGDPAVEARRLAAMVGFLASKGFRDGAARGAAKALLAAPDHAAALARFTHFFRVLEGWQIHGDDRYKFAARLLPAPGSDAEVIERLSDMATLSLASPLAKHPRRVQIDVALASMTTTRPSVKPTLERYLGLVVALGRSGLPRGSDPYDLALECMSCRGEPAEVVALAWQAAAHLSGGHAPNPEQMAMACAFAKRFAY